MSARKLVEPHFRGVSVGWVFLLAICIAMLSVPSWAQSTYGSVTGSVVDSSGAVMADAQVTLTNLGTSERRTQTTGSDGLFSGRRFIPSKA